MQLVQWMLHPDPLFRARVRDVIKHKWITQPVDVTQYTWEKVMPNYGELYFSVLSSSFF